MKPFRHSRAARWISQWLIPIMIAPLLVYYAPPTTAVEAGPATTGTVTVPAVIVLDFTNTSGYSGALVGRTAAATISQAMNESDNWDVLSSQQVSTALANLGLTPPLDLTGMMQLGRAVEADAVVFGQVYAVTFSENPRQARVGLRVEMRDTASGEMINGAIVTASSGARPGFTGDSQVLVDEALRKAAFQAVLEMAQNKLPRGTVLTTQVTGSGSREVLLNVGAQNGVREGMEFIITRGGVKASRIRVTRVEPDQSAAVVVESTQGAQPEDVATAVFSLPSVENVRPTVTGEIPTPQPRQRKKSGWGSALGAIIGIGLLVALLSGGTKSGRLTGPSGGNPAAEATSVNQDPMVSFPGTAVRVTWSVPNNVREDDVVQFTIIRSDLGNTRPAGIAGPGERVFIDGEYLRTLSFQELGGGQDTTGGAGGLTTRTEENIPGLVPGRPVTYQVQMIYRRRVTTTTTGTTDTGGGTTTGTTGTTTGGEAGGFTFAQTPVANTGRATPFPPPVLTDPLAGEPVDTPAAVTVSFNVPRQGVVGGAPVENLTLLNQGMVEFSRDPNFNNVKQVLLPQFSGSQAGQTVLVENLDLTRLFPGHRGLLYWHAGVKSTLDTPGPYPGIYANARGSNDRRWIYSAPETITIP